MKCKHKDDVHVKRRQKKLFKEGPKLFKCERPEVDFSSIALLRQIDMTDPWLCV